MEERMGGPSRGNGSHTATPAARGSDRPIHVLQRRRARVLVAIRNLGFHQEVLDHLERDPRIEIVSALDDSTRFLQAARTFEGDSIAVCPELAPSAGHPSLRGRGPSVVVVSQEMTVPFLREAIDLGARAVFCWPDEREELADGLAAVRETGAADESTRGRVLAVLGARGGAGTTFIATQLTAAVADAGGDPLSSIWTARSADSPWRSASDRICRFERSPTSSRSARSWRPSTWTMRSTVTLETSPLCWHRPRRSSLRTSQVASSGHRSPCSSERTMR